MSATMEWAVSADGQRVNAASFVGIAPRLRGVVTCLCCEEPVTPKAGASGLVVPHFAHRAGSSCALTNPETAAHFNAKMRAAEMIHARRGVRVIGRCPVGHPHLIAWDLPEAATVDVERAVGSRRPDVLVSLNGAPWLAVEVLHTHAVDAEKAADLNGSGVPWFEVRSADVLAWDGAEALRPTRLDAGSDASAAEHCVRCGAIRAEREHRVAAEVNADLERRALAAAMRDYEARLFRRRVALESLRASPPPLRVVCAVAMEGNPGAAAIAAGAINGKAMHTCEIVEEVGSGEAAWHALDHAIALVSRHADARPATYITNITSIENAANLPRHPRESDELRARVCEAIERTGSIVVFVSTRGAPAANDVEAVRWLAKAKDAAHRALESRFA